MSRVAYIRVSSEGQNVDRQLPDEKFDKTFTDKASAKDTDRPALAALLDYVRDGDKVVIHSIDRLARNLADLEQLVDQLNPKFSKIEKIKKFRLIPTTWDAVKEDGSTAELTPTMKLKRRVILEKFAREIEELYDV